MLRKRENNLETAVMAEKIHTIGPILERNAFEFPAKTIFIIMSKTSNLKEIYYLYSDNWDGCFKIEKKIYSFEILRRRKLKI